MNWSLIISLLVLPFIISFLGYVFLKSVKDSRIDKPINLSQYWYRLLSSNISLRQIIRFLLLIFPVIFLTQVIGVLPDYFLWIMLAVAIIGNILNQNVQTGDQSQEVLDALTEMSSRLTESRLHLEHLANLVKAKQIEVDEKERIRVELEKQIDEKSRETKELEKLSETQKELIVNVVRKSQKPTVIDTTGIIISSVALNLLATLIWTIMGNPGKDELINQMKTLSNLFSR
jgi:hypothetical protein